MSGHRDASRYMKRRSTSLIREIHVKTRDTTTRMSGGLPSKRPQVGVGEDVEKSCLQPHIHYDIVYNSHDVNSLKCPWGGG